MAIESHRTRWGNSRHPGNLRALTFVLSAVGLASSLSAGCGSTTSGKKAGLAIGCTVNSDCDAPLVCSFGLCHAACKVSGDCDSGERCVSSNGAGVCQLNQEATCTYDSDCAPTLFCAVDGRCRNQCRQPRDCLDGQVCTPSGACADTTEVGTNGELKNAGSDAGPSGAGGTSGSGGGGQVDTGGAPSSGADAGMSFGGLPNVGGFPSDGGFANAGGFAGMPGAGGATGTKDGGGPMPGCGQANQPCCPGEVCTAANAVCQTPMCVACGGPSQPCCVGDTCPASGTICSLGSCVSCGGLGQPCCGGSSCTTGGLSCISGICDVSCTLPEVAVFGTCVVPPPRPISPLSGSNLGTRSPVITWALPGGITTAHLDVCQDRACTNVLYATDVTGTSAEIGVSLAQGTSYFRLFSVNGGTQGTVSSPVWQMQIGGAHDAPKSTAWGAVPDFNGDGFADAVIQTGTGGSQTLRVYPGGPSGLGTSGTAFTSYTPNGGQGLSVGDVDGDGFVDLLLSEGPGVGIHRGSASGPSVAASQTLNLPMGKGGLVLADVNGDGYADLVAAESITDINSNQILQFNVYPGGPAGVSSSAQSLTTSLLDQDPMSTIDTSDFNGDGYADVVIGLMGPGTSNASAFYGGPAGLTNTPTTISVVDGIGVGASAAGDVNGDGYDDLIVLSQSARVYHGGPSGLSTTAANTLPTSGASLLKPGLSLGLGDANGDGYSDVLIPQSSPEMRVYFGAPSGLAVASYAALVPTPPVGFVATSSSFDAFSAAGDVDGDGFGDFAVAINWRDAQQLQNHQLYVFAGGAPVPSSPKNTAPAVVSVLR